MSTHSIAEKAFRYFGFSSDKTASAAPSSDSGLLARGARGDEVRELQSALRARGASIRADGIFGPKTEAAVRAFQAQNGAKVDGILGPETQALLDAPADSFKKSSSLREGTSGPKVSALQRQLAGRGYSLAVDGTFGPETKAAVQRFQRNAGIRVDGVVGPQTRAALNRQNAAPVLPPASGTRPSAPSNNNGAARTVNGVPVTLAPRGLTEAQQFDHYAGIVEAAGGKIEPGKPTVLALRGMDPDGSVHGTRTRLTHEDTIIVLKQGADGQKQVSTFTGSTYPGQRRSSQSPDITGDGTGDVGMLMEGNYSGTHHAHKGRDSIHIHTEGGSGTVPGVRDVNHDGKISQHEWDNYSNRGMTGVLIHGASAATGNVSSIGCFNVLNFSKFMSVIGDANVNITLLNAAGAEG